MQLTVLIENESASPALQPQHGLSLWLDTGQHHLLIDTGQDGTFLANAAHLGIEATSASHLLLTHGHYDHTGGLPALLAHCARPSVLIHPQAWAPRRSQRDDAPPRAIGIPWTRELLQETPVVEVTAPLQFLSGLWSTGAIPNRVGQSSNPTLLRDTAHGWQPDTFPDEQAVVLQTEAGLVVITGCCHAGLINTLLAAQTVTDVPAIFAVIGGLHLHALPAAQVAHLAEQLQPFHIQQFWVNHCTGRDACARLGDAVSATVQWASAGTRIELPPLITHSGGHDADEDSLATR